MSPLKKTFLTTLWESYPTNNHSSFICNTCSSPRLETTQKAVNRCLEKQIVAQPDCSMGKEWAVGATTWMNLKTVMKEADKKQCILFDSIDKYSRKYRLFCGDRCRSVVAWEVDIGEWGAGRTGVAEEAQRNFWEWGICSLWILAMVSWVCSMS